MEESTLVNRVANSGLITFNLEDYYPRAEIAHFDLKNFLFMELILKEKDFREALKSHDWTQYEDKIVLVYCSTDAIIPMWAYMLAATHLQPIAAEIFQGTQEAYLVNAYQKALAKIDPTDFAGKKMVIKGCSDKPVPAAAYLEITRILRPVAQSIMYGEPCSTVPIFKSK
jgi:Protein of unknown function (DUF2480)